MNISENINFELNAVLQEAHIKETDIKKFYIDNTEVTPVFVDGEIVNAILNNLDDKVILKGDDWVLTRERRDYEEFLDQSRVVWTFQKVMEFY